MFFFLENLILSSKDHLGYFWLIMSLTCLIIEISLPGLFFFVAFSAGCAITSIFAFMNYTFQTQSIIFITISLLVFFVLKKIFSTRSMQTNNSKTNMDALLGQKAVVVSIISQNKVYIKLRGDMWQAKMINEQFSIGEIVEIVGFESNTIIVRSNKK